MTRQLKARLQPFDSLWHSPGDVGEAYRTLPPYYRHNYLHRIPRAKDSRILVVGCGPGCFVTMLRDAGYTDVRGIDADPKKAELAAARGLPCEAAPGFDYLEAHEDAFDVVIFEQDLCHVTKDEMVDLLQVTRRTLRPGGMLVFYVLNGCNPLTGCSSWAETFDHFALYSAQALHPLLEWTGYEDTEVFRLNPYVFWKNPLNYIAMAVAALLTGFFRLVFILYGKGNRIFTKKIGATACRPVRDA